MLCFLLRLKAVWTLAWLTFKFFKNYWFERGREVGRERGREREREIDYVLWREIEPTTLAYRDIALTNWATWPRQVWLIFNPWVVSISFKAVLLRMTDGGCNDPFTHSDRGTTMNNETSSVCVSCRQEWHGQMTQSLIWCFQRCWEAFSKPTEGSRYWVSPRLSDFWDKNSFFLFGASL